MSIHRRQFLGTALAATSGFAPRVAAAARAESDANGKPRRHCIILWMSGGPSQLDTFDPKPRHANGGPVKAIATATPGMRISEYLPKLATHSESLAILRGMSTKEGDHARGTTLMRTGHPAGGPVSYPAITSSLSKELGRASSDLPDYISITPGGFTGTAVQAGFLGPRFAPMIVGATPNSITEFADLKVEYLTAKNSHALQAKAARLGLWRSMQDDFLRSRGSANAIAHDTVHRSAIRMLQSEAKEAFDLSKEPEEIRRRYGAGNFGQGCLMARRLIQSGVAVVEVTLGEGLGWDTHANNFEQVQQLCGNLDAAWSALIDDLRRHELFEQTTILWAGEFGRTPAINQNSGRDHFPAAFSCVLAGGGIRGGVVHGKTSNDGMEVIDGKVDQQDLLSTLCSAVAVNPYQENMAEAGRPIMIAEGNKIDEVLL